MLKHLFFIGCLLLGAFPRTSHAQGAYRFEGTIVDANTQRPLAGEVTVYGTITPDAMSHLFTGRNGGFTVWGETPGPYRFVVSALAYVSQEVPQSAVAGTPTNFTVRLVPQEVGAKMPLNTIRFRQSKAELLPESYPELDRLVAVLNANPALEIELNGHTDNQGDPAKNLLLSEQRVQTVVAFLTRQGIAATRLRSKGFGGTQPIAPNDVETNRAQNRRVELEILKR